MALTPYTRAYGNLPLTQITPFTYRDGLTFLQILNEFEKWLREVTPEIESLLKENADYIKGIEDNWITLWTEFMENVNAELEALNDQAVANLLNNPESKIREAFDALLEQFKADEITPDIELLRAELEDAVSTLTTGLNGVQAEINGRLSAAKITPYYIDLRVLGAVGNGIADDTAVWEQALAYAKTGSPLLPAKATVIMCAPGAKYRVTRELVVSSNTTIHGHGAEVIRDHSGYLLMNGTRGASYSGYSGNGNISVYDLTLNSNGNIQTGQGSTIAFAHAENLWWENVTVLNATSHGYEVNSQRNVTIKNCNFYGYRNADANNFVEAIQLDLAVVAGFGAFGAYDGTPCENIRITGCNFGRSSLLGAHPRAIGSHGGRVDRPHSRVTIEDCTFADHASMAIRPYNWNRVSVINCHGTNPGGFMQINTPIVGDGTSDNTKNASGVQTGASVANNGFTVIGCSSVAGMGVWIAGQESGRVRNVKVTECQFSDVSVSGSTRGFTGAWFDDVLIQGNSLSGFQLGIGFIGGSQEYRVKIVDNDIRYCFEHGIYVTNTKQLTILGNETYNSGYGHELGSHIRVSGASERFTVSGNNGYTNGSYSPNYGLYCATDNDIGILANNIYRGIGSVETVTIVPSSTLIDSNNIK